MSDEIVRSQQRYLDFLRRMNADDPSRTHFDFRQIYPESTDVDELLAQVDDLKACLDSFRPFSPEQAHNLDTYFATQYTYESSHIEGNTLTIQETTLVLERGLTVSGKPLKEHLEVTNHAQAFDYVKALARGNEPFSERVLRSLHQLILAGIDRKNAGMYRTIDVALMGSAVEPPPHFLLRQAMDTFFAFYAEGQDTLHPVLFAAELHARLVQIHPFVDGNGRTARLVMNLVLLQHGYPIANIRAEDRFGYYDALETADRDGNLTPFRLLILNAVKQSAIWYLERVSTTEDANKGGYFFTRIAPYLPPE
jgi:Fic family protein